MTERPQPSDPTTAIDATPVQDVAGRESSRELSLRSGRVPASVPGYDVLRCLGEGSFGMVWLARERKTGRQVAIKFFTNRRGLDWTLLTREVEKLAVLDASRDVVRLIDVGWDQDPPYFVMEYLPHESVAQLLEDGPLPVPRAVEIAESVARALVHSHGAGILHCDIKPANILLDHADDARLSDFGQSRLSSDQSPALGTFYYMAPEQAQLDAVPDVRWDVYALGAVLYHMVTGVPPYFSEESQQKIAEATELAERLDAYRTVIEESPFPNDHRSVPGVDGELATLIDDCLNPIAALRIPNAQVILDRIERRQINRSRRPLMWLGMLGPIVFLLMVLWIASTAVPLAVQEAEANLYERALSSEAATVRLLAASIDQELQERTSELEELAKLLPAEGENADENGFRIDLAEFLDEWKRKTDERFNKQRRRTDVSLVVNNRVGIQVHRSPYAKSVDQDYSYRDYFNGLGLEVERAHQPGRTYAPRRQSGISDAFVSSNTNRYMIAIAVPIWSPTGEEVIGVLARTIHITDLLSQWERRIRDDYGRPSTADEGDRLLSLVDMSLSHPFLLDHDWMTAENYEARKSNDEFDELITLSAQEERVLSDALAGQQMIAGYTDPLAEVDSKYEGIWLAAVAELKTVDWVAIIQERRSEAVAPMNEMRVIFLKFGLLLVVVFVAMLIGLGWLIRRITSV